MLIKVQGSFTEGKPKLFQNFKGIKENVCSRLTVRYDKEIGKKIRSEMRNNLPVITRQRNSESFQKNLQSE